MTEWPTARLDPVRQLRVLAEVLQGVGLVERVLDAPYEQLWAFLQDLERSVPAFDPMVRSLRVLAREGERLTVATWMPRLPIPLRFQVELRDGWCLMRSRLYLVGMAAVPLGDQTRYAHLEGLPVRGLAYAAAAVPPHRRRRRRRHQPRPGAAPTCVMTADPLAAWHSARILPAFCLVARLVECCPITGRR